MVAVMVTVVVAVSVDVAGYVNAFVDSPLLIGVEPGRVPAPAGDWLQSTVPAALITSACRLADSPGLRLLLELLTVMQGFPTTLHCACAVPAAIDASSAPQKHV